MTHNDLAGIGSELHRFRFLKALAVAPARAFSISSKNKRIIRDRSRISQDFSKTSANKCIDFS